MSDSNTLEKLKVLSVAVDYALKAGRVWDSNLYHGGMYTCPPVKDVLDFMETFHALDAFVYGTPFDVGFHSSNGIVTEV